MKKIVASVGVIALGASTLQSAEVTSVPGKPWNVSATLRGFYDDNVGGTPDTAPEADQVDSYGFEISPAFNINWGNDQTRVTAGYTYSYKYYDERLPREDDHDRQAHTIRANLYHVFSERYQLNVSDSFVIGQEPDLLRGGTFQPVPGDNIRNFGAISFSGMVTPLFGFEVGYENRFFDYEDDTILVNPDLSFIPSLSGRLDRIEHLFRIEGNWRALPQTRAILGYQYGIVDYTADQMIDVLLDSTVVFSEDRNTRSHYFYVGADHTFRPDLEGSIRVGARFLDYYNSPTDDSQTSPYVNANLRWQFAPESTLQVGASYDVSATDVVNRGVSGFNQDFVHSSENASIFGSVYHRILPKLYGSLMGQIQHSTYVNGDVDGDSDIYYTFGANLEYWIIPNVAAHIGYNFDQVDSDIGRDYQRNRVYIGVTARY